MNRSETADPSALIARHVALGWSLLFLFASLGVILEALHGFKIGWYLSVANETRRHLWTLAHAHGVLLALVHLGFAATLTIRPDPVARRRDVSSLALSGASILLPGGFFLGGIWARGGDPGLGILLVPVGGGLLLLAVGLTALGVRSTRSGVRPADRD